MRYRSDHVLRSVYISAGRLLRFHWLPRLLIVAVLATGCAPTETIEPDPFSPGLEPYSVQMHVHGHSHHNGDRRPGSMQWHSHFAAANDLDVLWWSDHSEMFDLSSALELNFGSASSPRPSSRQYLRQAGHRGTSGLLLGLIKAPPEDLEWLEAEDRSVANRKRLVARSPTGSEEFTEFLYGIGGAGGSPKGYLLPRPVSSGAVLALDMKSSELTPDVRIDVEVGLSWHRRGMARKHQLRYRLVPGSMSAQRTVTSPSTALITVPVRPGRARLLLDLYKDAALLVDGTDNTITSVRVRLSSRLGARASLDIFGLELSSRFPEPDHQLEEVRKFAASYETEYGHQQYVGVEFVSDPEEYVHINAFLPEGTLTGGLASGGEETWDDPAEFVRRVHDLGGTTSFNHLFGTATGQGGVRQQEKRSRARALDLLENRAYGTDILEVGYTRRGGVGLDYHLRTWDLLTARGLFLYGNGVSDAHGSPWGPEMTPNRFSTWIWSEGPSTEQLIEAIKQGHMVFGDPFAYSGNLYFRIGEAGMGDRVRVRSESQDLRVAVDEHFDPASHSLYLVQGRIRRSRQKIQYMSGDDGKGYRREITATEPVAVDVSRPCFLRLELYDSEGRPLRFTNPIVFDRKKKEAT